MFSPDQPLHDDALTHAPDSRRFYRKQGILNGGVCGVFWVAFQGHRGGICNVYHVREPSQVT